MKGGGTNRCAAGAGGIDTELFAWTEVGDDPGSWGGLSWAMPEKREEESLARFSPKQGRVLFFSKSLFYFCFPNLFCYFGNNLRIQNFLEYFKVTMDLLYI
jgi:hypothetical protein